MTLEVGFLAFLLLVFCSETFSMESAFFDFLLLVFSSVLPVFVDFAFPGYVICVVGCIIYVVRYIQP